jgi:hypothetical protein
LFSINEDTGNYIGGKVSIDDRPFTADERNAKKYENTVAEQAKNKETVSVQLPSTAIADARFNENEGKIYVTFVGGGKEYVFSGDRKTWLDFMNAGSKGRFLNYILKKYNRAPRSWWS